MGLNESEFARILELLGRRPTLTELGMFAVMWSEHCGYKYSRPVLALFKKYKEAMEGSGLENAGIVEIGEGLGVTMKVESHNHPSAVEPYQGAATGVGGIIRDILTMGARPITSLNSLRFGPIVEGAADKDVIDRNRYLFEHVVGGIAGYGNCVGVPTVAGEVAFHPRYSGNPLVNAMCVGLLRIDEVTTAAATGVGNPVIYLGSATGKDGIHGATFASDALGEDNEEKRPNVQIGDPFAEKQLIEATLEALQTGAIVAIQDMGAAGLTCSTIEMASKGGVGMRVDLDRVPMREADMSAYELMLSESQERMLAVAHRGREQEVLDVFAKWGLAAVVIGEVTGDGLLRVTRWGDEEVALDPKLLTDHCPTYRTEPEIPEYHRKAQAFDPAGLVDGLDPGDSLLALLKSPNLAGKRWVWQQYDQQVQTQTAIVCGEGDAAVLAPRGTPKGLAIKIDGNGRQVYFDPYVGGQLAVCEAARNVACVGGRPVAATDGLNFGNPQRPHVYWQFAEAVRGIADACETMGTPVISGNVSFYNESDLGEVLPTPLIGVLGVLDDAERRASMRPRLAETTIYILYLPGVEIRQEGLGASELGSLRGLEDGLPTAPDVAGERRLCELLATEIGSGLVDWAHDVSEGGLAVAAAEVAIVGATGLEIDLDPKALPFEGLATDAGRLFGEIPGWVLIGGDPSREAEVAAAAERHRVGWTKIGTQRASSGVFRVNLGGRRAIEMEVSRLREAYESALPNLMRHPLA